MKINDILSRVDHTLLDRCATWDDIRTTLDDGIKYSVASACIPPCYVKEAKDYVGDRLRICTVIGFPNGYCTKEVKVYEAADALRKGADEIDMVINAGLLKSGKHAELLDEIKAVKAACGEHILKVIVETCLLTEEEKILMCKIVSDSGADYIKTSTGFSHGGATFDDIALLSRHVTGGLKIKAAGGISSVADAEKFIKFGADRLGTSRIVKILKEGQK